MKVALEVNRTELHQPKFWIKKSKPFVKSTKGTLVHRPRTCTVHKLPSWPYHLAVHMYCGMGITGMETIFFMDEPEGDQVVCARCEDKATAKGRASSSFLVGRHVCTGGVRSFKRCCGK